jgi:hypothetical protein
MLFYERPYKAFVILGDPGLEPLWHARRWRRFALPFDQIFSACRAKALVRSGQFDMASKKEIKFGRLGWTPESEAKWTHASPNAASTQCSFFYTEASAPSLPVCGREGIAPDFYMVVLNDACVSKDIPLQFSPRIFLAIASDLPPAILHQLEEAVRSTSTLVNARLVATIERPWGFKTGFGFTDAIQDIAYGSLFKVGQPHARPLDLGTFAEAWELF